MAGDGPDFKKVKPLQMFCCSGVVEGASYFRLWGFSPLSLRSLAVVRIRAEARTYFASLTLPPQSGWPHKHMISILFPIPAQWSLQYFALLGGTQVQAALAHFLALAIAHLLCPVIWHIMDRI